MSTYEKLTEWKCVCGLTLPFWGTTTWDGYIRCQECKRVWTTGGIDVSGKEYAEDTVKKVGEEMKRVKVTLKATAPDSVQVNAQDRGLNITDQQINAVIDRYRALRKELASEEEKTIKEIIERGDKSGIPYERQISGVGVILWTGIKWRAKLNRQVEVWVDLQWVPTGFYIE